MKFNVPLPDLVNEPVPLINVLIVKLFDLLKVSEPLLMTPVGRVPMEPEGKPRRSLKEWLLGSPEDSHERGMVKDWYRARRRVGQEKLLHIAAVATGQSATNAAQALQEIANGTDPNSLEGQVSEALAASDAHFLVETHQAMNTAHRERYLDDLARS